jgi:hypothetical protein
VPPRIAEFRKWLIEEIPVPRNDTFGRQELGEMEFEKLLTTFINWRDRYVYPRKRKCYFYKNFWDEYSIKKGNEVNQIVKLLSNCGNLTPNLSRSIKYYGYCSDRYLKMHPRDRWKLYDLHLNGHSMHHIHLSKNGNERTEQLLFVLIKRDHFIVVGVGGHKDFDSARMTQRVAEINANQLSIQGISAVSPMVSNEERSILERNGMMSVYEVDRKFVIGALVTSRGTSLLATILADRMVECVWECESDWEHFARDEKIGKLGNEEQLRWRMDHCDLMLYNIDSKFALKFANTNWIR